MILVLNKIYQYVFKNWANIEDAIKKDLDESLKTAIRLKKITEIKKFFFEPVDEKSQPLINENNKSQFRAALRMLQSTHLEQVLYGNATDELEESYSFPDDKQIETLFYEKDKEYHYFDHTPDDTATALPRFKKFFQICKIVGDIIEHNNGEDNSTAINHAYKMLVVFGNKPYNDFQPIDDYLSCYNFHKNDTPLHDALISSIPIMEEKAFHLSEWRKLIQQTGPRGFQLFGMAAAIEKQLQKAPANYSEAIDAAKKVTYKNADQYLELANLCFQYKCSEEVFEKCLEVEKKRKTKDNLPTLSINGAEIGKPDYHLVKLPIHDPRAYLLGHITNCCQSIGGHSEECVIDGITRENNGFYVLLKAKKANVSTNPFDVKGNIDYTAFDIIGQGYAWISKHHNLTFDSWENLTPHRDDDVIAKMLTVFAKQLTQAKDSLFLRVTIGTGGKTPKILRTKSTTSEGMLEGTMYGDSISQSEIYCNEDKRNELCAEMGIDVYLSSIINSSINNQAKIDIFKTWFITASTGSYIEKTKQMFTTSVMTAFMKHLFTEEVHLREASKKPWDRVLDLYTTGVFTKLKELKLENEGEMSQLIFRYHYSAEVNLKALQILEKYQLKDDKKLIELVLKNAHLAEKICKSYVKLNELKLDNTAEVWQDILNNINYSDGILDSLALMIKLNMQGDKDIQKAVVQHASDALNVCKNITDGMYRLADLKLEKDADIRAAICKKPEDARKICDAFTLLTKLQLEHHPLARSYIFESGCSFLLMSGVNSKWFKPCFNDLEKLNEMKLDVNKKNVLVECILKYNQPYVLEDPIIEVYSYLCEHKLENIPELFETVFTRIPRKRFIDSYVKLREIILDNDSEIRRIFFQNLGIYYKLENIFLKLHKLQLAKDLEIRQHIFAQLDNADILINYFDSLTKIDLANDPQIRERIFVLFVLRKDNAAKSLIETLTHLKENYIQIDDAIKNKILHLDFPKFILFDLINAYRPYAIKLFDASKSNKSIPIYEGIKQYGYYYEKGKRMIEEIAEKQGETIEGIAKSLHIPNNDIFNNEYLVILVGQGEIDFQQLIKLGSSTLDTLFWTNIFTEEGVKMFNNKHLTFTEFLDILASSRNNDFLDFDTICDFFMNGGIILFEQEFRIQEYVKLAISDRQDINYILLSEQGKLAIKNNLTNVSDFLKIPAGERRSFMGRSTTRREYINQLELKPKLEIEPKVKIDPDSAPVKVNYAGLHTLSCVIS